MVNLPARIRRRSAARQQQNPILVTGAHRSGTTWVGRLLATAPHVFYLQEPFNFKSPNSLTTIRANQWYPYITEDNGQRYEEGIRDALRLKLRCFGEERLLWRHPIRLTKRMALAARISLLRWRADYRVLVKDPLALFATPWLSRKFGASPIILIRHPAAFVSSLKVNQWYPPFESLLSQPELIQHHFSDYAPEIARMGGKTRRDIIYEGALFWKLLYTVVNDYKQRFSKWLFIRHEDLSREPYTGFQEIFKYLGLEYTHKTHCRIQATTHREDRRYVLNATSTCDIVRESLENIYVWKQRLTPCEIERIRQIVGEVGEYYYCDADW